MRRWPVRVAAAAVAVVLPACSHPPSPVRASPSTTTVAPPATTTTAVTTVPVAPLTWRPCAGHKGWQCGTVDVPLDHADPGGPRIGVALSRHPATDPAHRVGALVVNPGGPGASGVAWAYEAAGGLLDRDLLADFDIIGFDPRGVGLSSPITCVDGPTLDRLNHLDPDGDTPAKEAALVAGARELAAACAARNPSLLPHLSTADVARDLDDIRAALGEAKLTYLGFSYGTLLGATYASLFPTRVRALALDGAEDPAVDTATMTLDQAEGFEHDLHDFFSWCGAAGSSCAFHRDGAPTLAAAFDALLAGIEAHPLPGAGGRIVGPGEALPGILQPLYDKNAWSVLADELGAAQRGDGRALLAAFDDYVMRGGDGTYTNAEVANAAVNCLDRPTPGLDELRALAASASRAAPEFGGPLMWGNLVCTYWPIPPVGRTGPLRAPGAPAIVVVGSTGDPVTRYDWARGLATELGSGVLVTRHGDGHAGYPFSQCVRTAVDRYLVSLTVPAGAATDCS